MEVSNSSALLEAFASDLAVAAALAQGIADALDGVESSMIDIISIDAARRRLMVSPRLLSAGTVVLDYRLVIPTARAAMANFTAASMVAIQDVMQVSVEAALDGVMAEKITISNFIASADSVVVRSSDEASSSSTTTTSNESSWLPQAFSDDIVSEETGAASAGIILIVVSSILLVVVVTLVLIRRRSRLRTSAKQTSGLDQEQGGGGSGEGINDAAGKEGGSSPPLQAELSEVVMDVGDDPTAGEHSKHVSFVLEPPMNDLLPEDDAPFMPASISAEPWRGFFKEAEKSPAPSLE